MERGDREIELGQRVTWLGAGVNAVLIVLKLAGGYLGNSQALVADAVHSVSDFFTDAVVLFGLKAGRKGPDDRHHFGHGRIETLASAMVGLSLISVGVALGYEAGMDLYHHRVGHPTWLAAAGALVSILAKEAMYQLTLRVGRQINSPAVMANAWHQRSDALSSVAVLIGILAGLIDPSLRALDSWAAMLVTLFIARVGVQITWTAALEVIDTAPGAEIQRQMQQCAESTPGVIEAHGLKVRTSGGIYQIQIDITVDGRMTVIEGHEIADRVKVRLFESLEGVGQVVVHVDPADATPAPTER